jgi:hypothetical protein
MRNLVFILAILNTMCYSQSKKEQIEYLSFQVDSIKIIQIKEQQLANSRESELNSKMKQLTDKISLLESTLQSVKTDLENKKISLSEKDSILAKTELVVKSLRDSLQFIIETMPSQLISSEELSLTNEELIKLINILPSELGPDFISEINPSLKPKYEIQGKQIFEWIGKKYALVVVGVTNPNDCHGCYGTNFINLLKWSSNQWVLVEKNNTFSIPTYGWGNFAELNTIRSMGKESIAIILSAGFTSQGMMEEYEVIYQFFDSRILKVFEGLLLENDGGNFGQKDIEYERSLIDNGREFFDLKETKKSHGKIVSTRTLKFNPLTQKYE